MANTQHFTPIQSKGALETFTRYMKQWIEWIDAHAEAISTGTATRETIKTFNLLLQNIALARPWIETMRECPTEPNGVTVQRLEYAQPNFISWPRQSRLESIRLNTLQAGKLGTGADAEPAKRKSR